LRERLRRRTLLAYPTGAFELGARQRPFVFAPEFGLAQAVRGPMDRVGRSLQALHPYEADSPFVQGLINLPRPGQYQIDPTLSWTVEDVLAATRDADASRPWTGAGPPGSATGMSARDAAIAKAADGYFGEGTARFRASLDEKDPADRAALMAASRHAF